MKSSLIKIVFAIGMLSSLLTGCQKGNFRFLGGKDGAWGDDDYYFDDDADDWNWEDEEDDKDDQPSNKGSSSGNNNKTSSNNNGGNNGNSGSTTDGGTFDEDSTKFGHSFSGTSAGEVAIYAKTANCTDTNLIVPSTYVDSKGTHYQVAMDCNNGFNALSAVSITLPDGFKKIVEGFDNCMYLKKVYLPASIIKIEKDILVNCIALEKIDFKGTKAQWNAIEKDDRWNYQTKAFIISCSDGTIEMQSWAESHPS